MEHPVRFPQVPIYRGRPLHCQTAARNGQALLLALDWRKAFDCISPDRLMIALRRFGLPPKMINVIRAIYTDREFTVLDDGVESSHRSQRAGISQGCPLSPFLFGILMTMLMEDAYGLLSPDAKAAHTSGNLGEVLYADDTLILGTASRYVEEYMLAIEACGKHYGLQIHAGKLQLVTVCQEQGVKDPNGNQIPSQASMLYLGATLHKNQRASSVRDKPQDWHCGRSVQGVEYNLEACCHLACSENPNLHSHCLQSARVCYSIELAHEERSAAPRWLLLLLLAEDSPDPSLLLFSYQQC